MTNYPTPEQPQSPIIGLVPAAGRGTRLGPIGFSKELYPIGGQRLLTRKPMVNGSSPPKAICEYLLEYFVLSGVRKAVVIIRPGKEDIREHLDQLENTGIDVSYLVVENSRSAPETLDRAFSLAENAIVALGFPDIILSPPDAFRHMLDKQRAVGADVVLGAFPTDQDYRSDMVVLDEDNRVQRIVIKQPPQGLTYSWVSAVWTPRFTRYLHAFLAEEEKQSQHRELHVGDVIQSAIDDGLHVHAVPFAEGYMVDIGTPHGLNEAKSRVEAAEKATSQPLHSWLRRQPD